VALAASCTQNGGLFCAYDNNQYTGRFYTSSAPAGSNEVNIPDDRLNSAHNRTNNRWCLYTNRVLSPPRLVMDLSQDSSVGTLFSDNNTVDWANVRSNSSGCP
jgi:hypothetical protein